ADLPRAEVAGGGGQSRVGPRPRPGQFARRDDIGPVGAGVGGEVERVGRFVVGGWGEFDFEFAFFFVGDRRSGARGEGGEGAGRTAFDFDVSHFRGRGAEPGQGHGQRRRFADFHVAEFEFF